MDKRRKRGGSHRKLDTDWAESLKTTRGGAHMQKKRGRGQNPDSEMQSNLEKNGKVFGDQPGFTGGENTHRFDNGNSEIYAKLNESLEGEGDPGNPPVGK